MSLCKSWIFPGVDMVHIFVNPSAQPFPLNFPDSPTGVLGVEFLFECPRMVGVGILDLPVKIALVGMD